MPTLADLQTELAQVKAAVSAAYSGQEFEIKDGATSRRLKRQDLNLLLRRQSELELAVARLDTTASGRGPSFAVPVDSGACLP